MFTKTKIALGVAIAIGIAVPPTTDAFAGNVYDSPDGAPPLYEWNAHRSSAAGTYDNNTQGTAARTREERAASRKQNAPRRGY